MTLSEALQFSLADVTVLADGSDRNVRLMLRPTPITTTSSKDG